MHKKTKNNYNKNKPQIKITKIYVLFMRKKNIISSDNIVYYRYMICIYYKLYFYYTDKTN